MDTKRAYDMWATQYDVEVNKTRDLEARAFRDTLEKISFRDCLEIGCGTGKNTEWLVRHARHVTAVDLSGAMLAKAKQKVQSDNVQFIQADVTRQWSFALTQYDLVSFSLVLEHIEHLDQVFTEASGVLKPGGYVYIGELHPYKQYTGTKAIFDKEHARYSPECFAHHVSDFVQTALKHGLVPVSVEEYFDDQNRSGIPRILMVLLQKS